MHLSFLAGDIKERQADASFCELSFDVQITVIVDLSLIHISAMFIFCNKNCNRVKIIEWDGDGFWLYQKLSLIHILDIIYTHII